MGSQVLPVARFPFRRLERKSRPVKLSDLNADVRKSDASDHLQGLSKIPDTSKMFFPLKFVNKLSKYNEPNQLVMTKTEQLEQ